MLLEAGADPTDEREGDIRIAPGPVRRPQHAGWLVYSEAPAVAVDDAAHPAALRGHCLCSFAVLHTDMRAPHSATDESQGAGQKISGVVSVGWSVAMG